MENDKLAKLLKKRLEEFFDFVDKKIKTTLNRPELALDYINSNLRFDSKKNDYYLDSDFEEQIFKAFFKIEPTEIIYHYTSLNALLSIIENNTIHLTSIAGMNDKSEATFADSLLKNGKKIKLTTEKIEQFNRRFIMCFTEKGDHFNQWRLYGNNGNGVAIGFKYKRPIKSEYYLALGRVIYGNDLPNMILKLLEDVKNEFGFNFSFRRLYVWKNYFKHIDYQYESETRLLLFNRKNNRFKQKDKFFKLNYYQILLPYVKLDLQDPNMPLEIKEIILGPNCVESEMNKSQIEYYLKEKKLNNIEVKMSIINHFRG